MRKILFLIFAFTAHTTYAQVGGGTTVVLNFAKNKVTMAADSRETPVSPPWPLGVPWPLGGPPNDSKCKITAFRNQIVLASTGATTSPFAFLSWTNVEVAQRAIQINEQMGVEIRLKQVVKSWITILERNWRLAYALRPREIAEFAETHGGILTTGFFAKHQDGTIVTQFVAIVLSKGEIHSVTLVPECVGKSLCAMGQIDVFNEFASGKTKRAKAEISRWLKAHTPPHRALLPSRPPFRLLPPPSTSRPTSYGRITVSRQPTRTGHPMLYLPAIASVVSQ